MPPAHFIDCHPPMDAWLGDAWPDLVIHHGPAEGAALRDRIGAAPVILCSRARLDAALLDDCPDLRGIVFLGGSPASYIDVAAVEARGIRLRTVTGYGNRSIAEHAFALMLAASRDIAAMDRALRSGQWAGRPGIELAGACLGVVGAGGVGTEMARLGAAFGMEVLTWNRGGALALDDLLARADVVSLHLALVPQTHHIIDARRLGLMRPEAILINTARGALVDEAALFEALRDGRLRHAGLDVFGREPLPADDPLLTLPNVTLTAHAAYRTPSATRRLLETGLALVAEELAR